MDGDLDTNGEGAGHLDLRGKGSGRGLAAQTGEAQQAVGCLHSLGSAQVGAGTLFIHAEEEGLQLLKCAH